MPLLGSSLGAPGLSVTPPAGGKRETEQLPAAATASPSEAGEAGALRRCFCLRISQGTAEEPPGSAAAPGWAARAGRAERSARELKDQQLLGSWCPACLTVSLKGEVRLESSRRQTELFDHASDLCRDGAEICVLLGWGGGLGLACESILLISKVSSVQYQSGC